MKFQIECYSVIGTRTKPYFSGNQDSFFYGEENGCACICLADGAGSKRASALGAQSLTGYIYSFLISNNDRIFNMKEEDLKREMADNIRYQLMQISESNDIPYKELGSTFLSVLTDGNRYICCHLGDGVILCERRFECGKHFNVLSFPENGLSKCCTALSTMDPAALKAHIRTEAGLCKNISEIWLMTDGGENSIFDEGYVIKRDFIDDFSGNKRLNMDIIKKMITEPEDDATFAYIEVHK